MSKSNYMVKITSTYTKTETYLVEDETKEDALYIVENQNQNPQYKCTLWNETVSDGEFDEPIAKEVLFKLDEDKKGYWEEVGEKNDN